MAKTSKACMNKKQVGHWFFYILVLLFFFVFMFGRRGVGMLVALKHSNYQLKSAITALTIKNLELAREIHHWKHCPFYKEQLAREKLQLAYPGDIIYYLA